MSEQEVLLSTTHQIENVIETYLDRRRNLITELVYSFDNRVQVYQYDVNNYKKEQKILQSTD